MSIKKQIMFQDNEIPRICQARWRSRSQHAIILVGHNMPRLEAVPTSQLSNHQPPYLLFLNIKQTMYVEGVSSQGVLSCVKTPARTRMVSAIGPSRLRSRDTVMSARLAERYVYINATWPEPCGFITSLLSSPRGRNGTIGTKIKRFTKPRRLDRSHDVSQ